MLSSKGEKDYLRCTIIVLLSPVPSLVHLEHPAPEKRTALKTDSSFLKRGGEVRGVENEARGGGGGGEPEKRTHQEVGNNRVG